MKQIVSSTNTRACKQVNPQENICHSCKFFLNFIISKYLKQEANLSICVDERSPCGLSTGDIKIYQSQMIKSYCYYLQCRSSPWTSIKELFLLTKFDNSSPLCNQGQRDLSKSHDYELMMSLPPDMEHPMELFE